jgi:DNA-binding NarL/FixJ family response regulator
MHRRERSGKEPVVMPGILIVADHAVAAEAIRRELRRGGPIKVLGYLDGGRSCATFVAQAAPDVVVFDEMRDAPCTLTRIREVRTAVPAAKLILLTLRMERQWLAEAVAAGVDAAIAKAIHPGSLGALLREVIQGNVFQTFAPGPVGRSCPEHAGLTARESEILRLVAAGTSNADIAQTLWVTQQTVKFHLSNVFRKLGVSNRTEASRYAHVHHIIDVPALSDAVTRVA